MDSRKIVILEDSTTNAIMLINHCIKKYGIDSFSWINLGSKLVPLASIQKKEVYTRIKENCNGDFLFETNYYSTKNFQDVIDKLNEINKGKFLIFYDLQLGRSDHTEISKKIGELVSKSKDMIGLCVFVLLYSSSQGRQKHLKLIDITETYAKVSNNDFYGTYEELNAIAEKIFNQGNEGFDNICETGLVTKIWPEYTKDWFDDKVASQKVPHDYSLIIDKTKKETCKKEVQKYLTNLLSPGKVPQDWSTESQFSYLYNDLKGLVGSLSAFQGNQGDESYPKHRLTLGNFVIILAAIDKKNSHNWLASISWNKGNSERTILPKQNYKQAMEVIDCIIDENKGIQKLIFDKHNRTHLIKQVIMQDNRLKVILNLPFADKLKKKVLTLKSTESGGTYDFYKNFLITSGITDFGRQAECAINLFSEKNQTVLEVISCA